MQIWGLERNLGARDECLIQPYDTRNRGFKKNTNFHGSPNETIKTDSQAGPSALISFLSMLAVEFKCHKLLTPSDAESLTSPGGASCIFPVPKYHTCSWYTPPEAVFEAFLRVTLVSHLTWAFPQKSITGLGWYLTLNSAIPSFSGPCVRP